MNAVSLIEGDQIVLFSSFTDDSKCKILSGSIGKLILQKVLKMSELFYLRNLMPNDGFFKKTPSQYCHLLFPLE